jgi:lipopolysaccharide biosynthesis glycosyltransferase
MKTEIHIACSIDRNYIQHIGVTLTSLFENNTNCRFNVHLFSSEFEEEELTAIKSICNNYHHAFTYYFLNPKLFDGFFLSNHITVASYYRIFIPERLPYHIEKCIYLDADLIIKKDVEVLFSVSLEDKMIAGIPDPNQDNINNERLGIPLTHRYLNAGVLILNCKKWRNGNWTEKLTHYIIKNHDIIYFHDQDTLNKNFFDDCLYLDLKWNLQTAVYELPRKKLVEVYGENQMNEAIHSPAIIHYTGSSKPWDYLNMHPLRKEYFKYLYLTPWKGYKYPSVTVAKRIQKWLMYLMGERRFQTVFSFFKTK